MVSLTSLIVLLFAAAVAALSTTGNRLLVVLDNVADQSAYALFFGDLKGKLRVPTPSLKTGSDRLCVYSARFFPLVRDAAQRRAAAVPTRSAHLRPHHLLPHKGQRCDGWLVSSPRPRAHHATGLGPNLKPSHLADFAKSGGNVLVALSSKTPASTSITALLAELDVALPAERTGTVVDHFNYDSLSAADAHDVLVIDGPTTPRPGVKDILAMPGAVLAMPRTAGHIPGQSKLLTPLMRAPSTAYSYNPKEKFAAVDPDDLFAAGRQLALASVVQLRNSARVVILGSVEMLQDAWIDAQASRVGAAKTKAANRDFAKRLTGWAFQEIGVLRVNSVEHRLRGHNETNPTIYRIKNHVVSVVTLLFFVGFLALLTPPAAQSYSISMSEYSWDKWTPLTLPDEDSLQLEFSMLSPFYRLNLVPTQVTETATVFSQDFQLPDQHGIFNFMVNYKRPLLTYVEEKRTVSVRHMAHDEWPRSFVISGAWPWLSGIATTVAGFVVFCGLWMYSKPAIEGGKTT